jgi:predicted O-linked N-acetylglucosamine transferase (SPINDLY family)
VEQTIRADQPDILIDLAGHTAMTSRLPLFARHLAPVQITYLGYPNTTGLPAMGYRLVDAITDPVGEADRFATEKLVRYAPTAWSYEPPAEAPLPGPLPGTTRPGITFGCCNNPAKCTDTMLQLWHRVLQAVPGSRLLLKGSGLGEPAMRAEFLARLQQLGLRAEQIELFDRTRSTADHLAFYQAVDLAFDTHPYHGTTPTCEALWMGVPVVTLLGDRHASRVGASLLTAIGHPEWIADDTNDYIRIATELATDLPRLRQIRAALRDDLRRSVLLDHAGQAALFGAALNACWTEWCGPTQPVPTGKVLAAG